MNATYSKQEVLLESVVKILRDDNASTGNDVDSIGVYVNDRIVRPFTFADISFPKIVVDVDGLEANSSIATQEFVVDVDTFIKSNHTGGNAKTILGRIAARVETLLNRKHLDLNAQTSKNLRCRLFVLISTTSSYDALNELFSIKKSFRVICDDEILTL